MSDMTMGERVARALCAADGYSWAEDELYMRQARAAIEAMRTPTQHMLVLGSCYEDPEERYAGDIKLGIKAEGAIAGEVWQAMIDAALSEQKP